MRLTAGGGYGRLVEEGERTLGVAKWWDVISGDKSYCLHDNLVANTQSCLQPTAKEFQSFLIGTSFTILHAISLFMQPVQACNQVLTSAKDS